MQERFIDIRATKYRDFVEGQLNLGEIIRIEREHDKYSVSNKVFDFTSNTINHLIQNGHDDVIDYLETRFSTEYLKNIGMQINV